MNSQSITDMIGSLPPWTWLIPPALLVFSILRYFSQRGADPDYLVNARCRQCSWQGKVSRYKPICRQCNSTISLGPKPR